MTRMERIKRKRRNDKITTAIMSIIALSGWAGIWAWYFIILTN